MNPPDHSAHALRPPATVAAASPSSTPAGASPEPPATAGPADVPRRARADADDLMDLMAMPAERRGEMHLGRRERRRLETFERLVAVARDILFAQNLKRVAVEDITTGADTGKGTFFNYFPTKEQIVPSQMALIERSLAESLTRVERDGVPAPQAMIDRFVNYLCPATGDWLTYEQNLIQSLLEPESRHTFSGRIRHTRATYDRLMELGQQQGTIRTDLAPADLGMVAHTMVVGLTIMFWIHGAAPTRETAEQAARNVARLLQPVAAPPPARPKRQPPAAKRAASSPGRASAKKSPPAKASSRKSTKRTAGKPARTPARPRTATAARHSKRAPRRKP